MDNNKTFPEQGAPAKNTDNAFVQVGEDGQPVIPEGGDKKKGEDKTEPDPVANS